MNNLIQHRKAIALLQKVQGGDLLKRKGDEQEQLSLNTESTP